MDPQTHEIDTLIRIHPDAATMEKTVTQWLAQQTPLLWVPIIDVDSFSDAQEVARESARDMDGGWLILQRADFLTLPEGIKGWLLPVGTEDTNVACGRWQKEIYFLRIHDKASGAAVTYRTDVGITPLNP